MFSFVKKPSLRYKKRNLNIRDEQKIHALGVVDIEVMHRPF